MPCRRRLATSHRSFPRALFDAVMQYLPASGFHAELIHEELESNMSMSQKIAIVTGAGSGIGKAVALALCREGYSVALAGRRRRPLQQASRSGPRRPPLAIPTDVADPIPSRRSSPGRQTFGRLDLLFNNAGIGAPRHSARRNHLRSNGRPSSTSISPAHSSARRKRSAS